MTDDLTPTPDDDPIDLESMARDLDPEIAALLAAPGVNDEFDDEDATAVAELRARIADSPPLPGSDVIDAQIARALEELPAPAAPPVPKVASLDQARRRRRLQAFPAVAAAAVVVLAGVAGIFAFGNGLGGSDDDSADTAGVVTQTAADEASDDAAEFSIATEEAAVASTQAPAATEAAADTEAPAPTVAPVETEAPAETEAAADGRADADSQESAAGDDSGADAAGETTESTEAPATPTDPTILDTEIGPACRQNLTDFFPGSVVTEALPTEDPAVVDIALRLDSGEVREFRLLVDECGVDADMATVLNAVP